LNAYSTVAGPDDDVLTAVEQVRFRTVAGVDAETDVPPALPVDGS